jgi:hypothetical protein
MIERRFWLARAVAGVTLALALACVPATLLAASGRDAPGSFGMRVGPFYVAAFTTRTAHCSPGADCDPALMTGPTSRRYEVWLFTRRAPGLPGTPRVDLLLALPLRS